MSPPAYSDLGKEARDIFSKNYHFGNLKLDLKTKSSTGVKFNVQGLSQIPSGDFSGFLETKYVIKDVKATLKEKWTTNNTVLTECSIDDLVIKGLTVAVGANFSPSSGAKKILVKSGYKNNFINVAMDADMDNSAWLLNGSMVTNYQGLFLGAKINYDARNRKLNSTNLALGYSTNDFILTTNAKDGKQFGASIYQSVNRELKTGIDIAFTSGSNISSFAFGCIYSLPNSETILRAKLNNASQLGLGMSHNVSKGITLHLSSQIDGKNFAQGGHKLGLGLEMEA